jgi:hypothetical protein
MCCSSANSDCLKIKSLSAPSNWRSIAVGIAILQIQQGPNASIPPQVGAYFISTSPILYLVPAAAECVTLYGKTSNVEPTKLRKTQLPSKAQPPEGHCLRITLRSPQKGAGSV